MNLAALRAVVTVAETLHFGRAAQRLGIAQPMVSQRVRRVETEVGFDIFHRDPAGVRLTPAGALVVAHARETVSAADRLEYAADQLRRGTAGVVRVGCVGSALFGALTAVLAECRLRLPDVELRVREMESPEQVTALLAGELDVGFLRPPGHPQLRIRPVWSEPLILAVPDQDPLTAATTVGPEDLAGRRVLVFPRRAGPGYWEQVVSALADTNADLVETHDADHITTLLGVVALGAGITLVPESLRRVNLPGVTYRPLRRTSRMRLAAATIRGEVGPATARVLETLPRVE